MFTTVCKYVDYSIKDVQITTGETNIDVTWNPVCNNTLNVYIIPNKTKIKSKNRDYVLKTTGDHIDNLSKQYKKNQLTSFTNYELIIENEIGEIRSSYLFTTKPSAEETTVQDLSVFERDEKSIKIRWRPPKDNESISFYQALVRKCYPSSSQIRFITVNVAPCNIWLDWICYVQPISSQDCYEIQIRAYYNEPEMPGCETSVWIENFKESDPPEIIKFDQETLTLCWNHPNFTRGQLQSFSINFISINSNVKEPSFSFNYRITQDDYKLEYCKKFDFQLEFSTTYQISINTKSSSDSSKNEILNFNTKPVEPKLVNNISFGAHTNTTQQITIPQITPETITSNSKIYVQVCDNNAQMAKTKYKDFENITNCSGFSWIAAKITETNRENNLIIGDLSKNGYDSFIENLPLNESVTYTIYVILINEYMGEKSYNIYSNELNNFENVSNSWNPLWLLLLLLLIIPIIVFLIYRKRQNQFFIPSFNNRNTSANRNDMDDLLYLKKVEDFSPGNNSSKAPLLKTNEKPIVKTKPTVPEKFSRIVKINNLSDYVKKSLENGELEKQHALFQKGATKPWEYGLMKQNKFKNRYNNLTAYDHSRIVLNKLDGDPFSDYINANYIDGYKQKNAYIATQGPKPNTVNDFWRMIWQENVHFIVMLANLTEGGKKKCEQYWPELGATQDNINLSITYLKSDIYANFEYRTFQVTNGPQSRLVQQLHFTSWPDHGVPLYPQSLVPFLRKMSDIPIGKAPIVVHCSAGVGRTGTIILTDICLRMAAAEGQVDVLKYLHTIRENRANLVDNFNQYKLVHMVLLEYLLAPDTNIPCNQNMAKHIENLIETGLYRDQLASLKTTAWHNKVMMTKKEIHPENIPKNRFPLIALDDSTRIYISRFPYDDEHSDYINAIPVDGFQIKNQFIVTQNPMPNTLKDFWRMVDEQNSKVIVSLNDFETDDETCSIFWPNPNEEMKPMPHFIVQHKSETNFDYFDVIKVQITNMNAEEGSEVSSVKIIQFKKWKRDSHLPENPNVLISLYEKAHSSCRDGSPMIITCYDGTTACGVFVALTFVIEKIKLEQLCDVSLATRVVRYNREQFIINEKQFLFLYKAALEYVNSFEEYGNFQGPPIYP